MNSVSNDLPGVYYTAEQVRELDRICIEDRGIPGFTLMQTAGQAAFELFQKNWPQHQNIIVVCGLGNNAGDGYVFAVLAATAGLTVRVMQAGDTDKLAGDAQRSYEAFIEQGGELIEFNEKELQNSDLIVDGLFGTGLDRPVSGDWATMINAINRTNKPVLALDIPSGLHADSGCIMGTAIRATKTISFIALKRGMFTAAAADHCGEIHYSDLSAPTDVFAEISGETVTAINLDSTQHLLKPRDQNSHKGDYGHVLCIGGDHGYVGAIRMAAEAAARCGAGLVSVATRQSHADLIAMARPELMCHGVADYTDLSGLLDKASVIAIGPGLGQGEWSQKLFARVLESKLPMVIDADALSLLAGEAQFSDNHVITPHPGEAARLLGTTTADIQADRFQAIKKLRAIYGGVVVLKGAGSLIIDVHDQIYLMHEGNPGMASGGMGDVLTGVIAALIAQGLAISDAAKLGVALHARAADEAALDGQRGLLASDLLVPMRRLLK